MEGYLMMTSEEASWITRAKAGDQAAFAAIFTRYERRIYNFIYRMMGNVEDANDLTQETFLKAYRALDKTDQELNINAWLHRIAANACLDVLRRRRRFRWFYWEEARHDEPSQRVEDNPERSVVGDESQELVRRVLARLTPRYRQALILREYEGLSVNEIAEVMNASRSAVKSMLFRAREEFRRLYALLEDES